MLVWRLVGRANDKAERAGIHINVHDNLRAFRRASHIAIHKLSLPRAPIIHACGRVQVSIQRAKAMRYMFGLR